MTEPDQTEQTPDSVSTHEEVTESPEGEVTHTLDTEVSADSSDGAAEGSDD
jgi:hypothetical protein